MSFDVVFPGGGKPLPVTLALPGHHNVLNALAALCVGHQLGVAFPRMREALASFEGINRRFQLRDELPCKDGTFLLVDDYAHHPRELAATLAAAAGGWPRRRRVVVFQPHRYSRVRDLLDELADVLKDCEPLFVTEVYPAGEKAIAGADGAALCDAIRARGGTPLFVHHPDALPGMLHGVVRHDDMLLLLGAGDISEVAGRIAEHGIRSPAEAEAEAEAEAGLRGGRAARGRAARGRAAECVMNLGAPMVMEWPDGGSGGGALRRREPMSRHTSWRAGGPADLFFVPADRAGLADFLMRLPPEAAIVWSGLGSNLLVRDGGIRGVVISLHKALVAIRAEPDAPFSLYAEAGAPCNRIARRSVALGMGGAEFLCGIPGTLGGALAMNAGAFGGETWNIVRRVETVDRHGQFHRRDAGEYEAGYRRLSGPPGEWFVAAQLGLREPQAGDGGALIESFLEHRNRTQPAGIPSAGSVFRNPPGDYAARLIESAGLKGRARGAARVSEQHANFIVNEGGARAADIEALIGEIREEVRRVYGVRLATEVRIVGEEG